MGGGVQPTRSTSARERRKKDRRETLRPQSTEEEVRLQFKLQTVSSWLNVIHLKLVAIFFRNL